MRNQLLHWAGLLVAVRLVFEMLYKGRLDNENTGLVILLLLALSMFIAASIWAGVCAWWGVFWARHS